MLTLTQLNLSGNTEIDSASWLALTELLFTQGQLRALNLSWCRLGGKEMASIIAGIKAGIGKRLQLQESSDDAPSKAPFHACELQELELTGNRGVPGQ